MELFALSCSLAKPVPAVFLRTAPTTPPAADLVTEINLLSLFVSSSSTCSSSGFSDWSETSSPDPLAAAPQPKTVRRSHGQSHPLRTGLSFSQQPFSTTRPWIQDGEPSEARALVPSVLIPFDAARVPDSVHQEAMWPNCVARSMRVHAQ